MKNKKLSLPGIFFLLAFSMMIDGKANADEVVNTLSPVAEEASQQANISNQIQGAAKTTPASTSAVVTNNVAKVETSPQDVTLNTDQSTVMQAPVGQHPSDIATVQEAPAQQTTNNNNNIAEDYNYYNNVYDIEGNTSKSIVASQTGTAIADVNTNKATYGENEDVHVQVDFTNTTDVAQDITLTTEVYHLNDKIATYKFTKNLQAGETYKMQEDDLVLAHDQFQMDRGYLLNFKVSDSKDTVLSELNRAVAYEKDWTKFPRYGVVGGSQMTDNSLLVKDEQAYKNALEKMKNMNINSYFFYDVYDTPTNPYPGSDVKHFDQEWNTWSHSSIDTEAVKKIVDQVHDGGAKAMLYNMILAQASNEADVLSNAADHYVYNTANGEEHGYGKVGEVMQYIIDGTPLQNYYNPKDPAWQEFIGQAMAKAMINGNFDGWQGDTIGDNLVTDSAHRGSTNEEDQFWLTEGYAEFLNNVRTIITDEYKKAGHADKDFYLTLNDVNGEQINRLKDGNQDVIYNEIWDFGGSALSNVVGHHRNQSEYGDLKARVDEIRQVTGKSAIIGAYMEEPKYDKVMVDGKEVEVPANGAARDVEAAKTADGRDKGFFQDDAVLLTTATIAAAGGYHMSLAAVGNIRNADGIGVLETAYYPTQSLKVSERLSRKNNDYQQFITAYENILRDGVENDQAAVDTYNANGDLLSTDDLGITGNQVWTYGKKGQDFRTVQLLNLMGINSDWKNSDGTESKKTPDAQKDLTVKYTLTDVTMAQAQRMANQTYVVSPDDWSNSTMKKVAASVETDANGNIVLSINVPELTLWDVIYISEKEESATDAPVYELTGKTTDTVVETPAVEEAPAAEEVAETPAVEEAPAAEAVVETPAVEEAPAAEEVVVETPAEEEAPAAESVVETPAVEEAPAAEEVVVETPAVEEAPAAEEVVVETPAVEEAPVVEPVVEQPAVEEAPATEEVAETPAVEEATPAVEPVVEQPAEEATPAVEPVVEQPAEEATPAAEPVVEQPAKEVAETPVVEEIPAVPAAEAQTEAQPATEEVVATPVVEVAPVASDTVAAPEAMATEVESFVELAQAIQNNIETAQAQDNSLVMLSSVVVELPSMTPATSEASAAAPSSANAIVSEEAASAKSATAAAESASASTATDSVAKDSDAKTVAADAKATKSPLSAAAGVLSALGLAIAGTVGAVISRKKN